MQDILDKMWKLSFHDQKISLAYYRIKVINGIKYFVKNISCDRITVINGINYFDNHMEQKAYNCIPGWLSVPFQ